jgi:hypothetical protein
MQPLAGSAGEIAWGRLTGFPAAVWNITAGDWPAGSDGSGLAKGRLAAWWSMDAHSPYSATLKRNEKRPGIAEMAGVALKTADDTVTVESIAIENHYVEVAAGQRAMQPCLVVRLTSTPGNIYWAELMGLETAGVEQRFYPSIGGYTALFWPVTEAEVERTLQGIGVVSPDVFQREAKASGNFVEFESLAAPDARDILPTPSFSFE